MFEIKDNLEIPTPIRQGFRMFVIGLILETDKRIIMQN